MKDIKAYIKLEDSTEAGDYILTNQEDNNMSYAKEISLTDAILGFEKFKEGYVALGSMFVKCEEYYGKTKKDWILITIESLLEIYFKEKGIINE